MLAKGDEEEFDEEDDESTPMAQGPKQAEHGDSSKQAEPKEGTRNVAGDAWLKDPVETVVNHEDITKDQICIYLCSSFVHI